MNMPDQRLQILFDIMDERARQIKMWGVQDLPDFDNTVIRDWKLDEMLLKALNGEEAKGWNAVLLEEVFEAFATEYEEKLKEELIQVAAVCVAWIENIERRRHGS